MRLPVHLVALAAVGAGAAACIPDRGALQPVDAAPPERVANSVDGAPPRDAPPPPRDQEPAEGASDAAPSDPPDAAPADTEPPPPDMTAGATCGKPDYVIMQSGINSSYLIDKLELDAGLCVEYCVLNEAGEPHTNDSDDKLFDATNFKVSGGNMDCRTFFRRLVKRAQPYRLFCEEHKTMDWFLTVR